jgi:hypothetical protein
MAKTPDHVEYDFTHCVLSSMAQETLKDYQIPTVIVGVRKPDLLLYQKYGQFVNFFILNDETIPPERQQGFRNIKFLQPTNRVLRALIMDPNAPPDMGLMVDDSDQGKSLETAVKALRAETLKNLSLLSQAELDLENFITCAISQQKGYPEFASALIGTFHSLLHPEDHY